MFSYICRTRFVDQDISAGLQYFIIMLFFFIYLKTIPASVIWILHFAVLGVNLNIGVVEIINYLNILDQRDFDKTGKNSKPYLVPASEVCRFSI